MDNNDEIVIKELKSSIENDMQNYVFTPDTDETKKCIDQTIYKAARDKEAENIATVKYNTIFINNDIEFDMYSTYTNQLFFLLPYFKDSPIKEGESYEVMYHGEAIGKVTYTKKRDTCEQDEHHHFIVGWEFEVFAYYIRCTVDINNLSNFTVKGNTEINS